MSLKFVGTVNKFHDYLASKMGYSGWVNFPQAFRKNKN